MDWERKKRTDERIGMWLVIIAAALMAIIIKFQDTIYPAIAAALRWVGAL